MVPRVKPLPGVDAVIEQIAQILTVLPQTPTPGAVDGRESRLLVIAEIVTVNWISNSQVVFWQDSRGGFSPWRAGKMFPGASRW